MCSALVATSDTFDCVDKQTLASASIKEYLQAVGKARRSAGEGAPSSAEHTSGWPILFPEDKVLASAFYRHFGKVFEECQLDMGCMRQGFNDLIAPFQKKYGMPGVKTTCPEGLLVEVLAKYHCHSWHIKQIAEDKPSGLCRATGMSILPQQS